MLFKRRWFWWVMFSAVVIFVVGIVGLYTFLGYYWHQVKDTEIGVETIAGNVTTVLGPGIHSNRKMWADLHDVNIKQLPWCAVDPEVLTSDNQRLGFVVCGTVQRPGLADIVPGSEDNYYTYLNGKNWVAFKDYYVGDNSLAGRYHTETNGQRQVYIIDQSGLMQTLAQQAMKSCVGDRDFDSAVVGKSRDDLRMCIDENVSQLAANYGGLKVENVVVPDVILGDQVQQKLDEITQSKFATEFEQQEALRKEAEAEKLLAEEQGKILVSEGKAQEEARQKALTAQLEAEAEIARQELIQAQKDNEILEANLNLKIAEIKLEAAKLEAQQTHAWDVILSNLLAEYPQYAEYLMLKAAVEGWQDLDKVILPAGVDPFTVINPWGTGSDVIVDSTP